MNEFESLVQIVVVVAATVVPVVGAIRLLAGRDSERDGVTRPDASWPLGVREEEPQRWGLGAAC